jgi:hypothetical protein
VIDDLIFLEQLIKKVAMPDRYKTAVIGYFFEGKTYDEVGADLGCGRQRASQILRRAVRRMRERCDALPARYKWLKPIVQTPKEERISKAEYYRLLNLEEL